MVRNGEPIKFSAKTKKPITLLKALLAAGGREVSLLQLADTLWPEADGDSAHNSLNVTLYRLRKLLGEHDAIQLMDSKMSLNSQLCWVDVWEFERQLNSVDAMLKTAQPSPESIRAESSKLLEICQGGFLKGETCAMIIAMRKRLHGKFLRVLDAIGQFWEKLGEWSHARQFYQKGLELEPMLEALYQRLMICHREMGERAEAMVVYHLCQESLSTHLNLTPSLQTEAIRRTLID